MRLAEILFPEHTWSDKCTLELWWIYLCWWGLFIGLNNSERMATCAVRSSWNILLNKMHSLMQLYQPNTCFKDNFSCQLRNKVLSTLKYNRYNINNKYIAVKIDCSILWNIFWKVYNQLWRDYPGILAVAVSVSVAQWPACFLVMWFWRVLSK